MFEVIETTNSLRLFVDKLKNSSWVALDTEFIRERTYYAKLCLIQIEADGHRACIDPLKVDDLTPLAELLNNPDITKVFHAAHQDLEILSQVLGEIPSPIFDTQVAAAVLGIGDQMSYARLVEAVLNVQLEKTQSRTDWSRRPLKSAQLEYAIDDVRYLAQVYPKMLEQLKNKGRLGWLNKDFNKAVDPKTYEINPQSRWKKVRGNQILKRPQLAVLRELAAWREEKAERADLPRKWIINDDILLDLARQQPRSSEQINDIRGVTDKMGKYHKTWLELINKANALPESEWPELPRSKKPTPTQNTLIDLLMIVLNIKAKENGITAASIATRKQIAQMVQSGSTILSEDWRGAIVNEEFARILSGDVVVGVENAKVKLLNRA